MNTKFFLKSLRIIIPVAILIVLYFAFKDPKMINIKNEAVPVQSHDEIFQEEALNLEKDVSEEKNDNTEGGSIKEEAERITTKENKNPSVVGDDNEEKNSDDKIEDKPKINNKYVSWGYQSSSGRKIDTIIIHSSYDALGGDPYDTDGLIDEYRQYGVAAHYLINRKGKIYQLVRDKDIAYHAGTSSVPDGRNNVNSFSIGIELMNTKEDKFTADQYSSLNSLLGYLKSEYNIKYTLGHDQIAPGRKTDPWNFDWSKIKQ